MSVICFSGDSCWNSLWQFASSGGRSRSRIPSTPAS